VTSAEAADRRTAGLAMLCAPLVGLVLGGGAALAGWIALRATGSPVLAAIGAVAALAALTRGLHLDGLADTADGLGSAKPAAAALDIMKRSDIGPFGVVTIVLALAAQIAALAVAYGVGIGSGIGSEPGAGGVGAWFGRGAVAIITGAVAGRLAITAACTPRTPAARPDGLGAWVGGTVPLPAAVGAASLALIGCASLGLAVDTRTAILAAVAILASLLAAVLLLRRCVRRFGGITGDVLGALVETAATTALLVLAVR
jgi:adenosylcobinamide-GDP ribazoletransferase